MKTTNFIFPLLVLLGAVGGAFATQSMNRIAPTTVWFLDDESNPESCTPTDLELEPCEATSQVSCIKQVPTSAGLQNREIFEDNQCEDPYQRPEAR